MATDGAAIASVPVVEETIAAAAAPWPIGATMHEVERPFAAAACSGQAESMPRQLV